MSSDESVPSQRHGSTVPLTSAHVRRGDVTAARASAVGMLRSWPSAAVQVVTQRRPSRLRRRVVLAEAVAELSHWALNASQPDELLEESLRVAVEIIGADYGTAVRRLPDGRLRVARELGPQPLAPGTMLSVSPDRSYLLQVIETGQPLVSADLRCDPRIAPPRLLLTRGIVSGLAVPVRGAEAVMGVLALHSRHRRRFNRDELAAASALASVVATAWEQAEQRKRLSHQALHDPLTGLPNRALFLDRLDLALARRTAAEDVDQPSGVAVMLIDLDEFKWVNDRFGHAAGDRLLRMAAHRLLSAVRPQDTIARLGGDEFGLLCDLITDEAAVRLAERMRTACSQPVDVSGSPLTVSASFGITFGNLPTAKARSSAVLLGEADAALYRAKDRGRGQIQVFDDRLQRALRRRRQMELDLAKALERNELRLHYQPARRSSDLHTVGLEALVRWQHPSRGLLLPDEFIPIAEQTGLIVPLGEWVLHAACEQAARWQREQAPSEAPIWLAVNVSPRQLDDPQLPATVTAAQQEAALAPGSLVLELTESAILAGDATHHDALNRLRSTGVRLFLDDFGTGYSSLTHLSHLPIQAVKIDRSFVAGLPGNRRNAAVVSFLITLSADLGLQVIAEGVETSEQLQALQLMHCNVVQGFLLDRPKPAPVLAPPPLVAAQWP
ncbi:hypothetical protein BH18ACT9_BH18ACT9_04910 [soil metagenome]